MKELEMENEYVWFSMLNLLKFLRFKKIRVLLQNLIFKRNKR